MTLLSRRVEISFQWEREIVQRLVAALTKFLRHLCPPGTRAGLCVLPLQPASAPLRAEESADAGRRAPTAKAGLATLNDTYGPLPASALALEVPCVDTLVLDASALSALADGNVQARAYVTRAANSLARILVPATEVRNATHQRIAEALADIVPIDRARASFAAMLIARTPGADPYAALTVATAAARAERAAILTTAQVFVCWELLMALQYDRSHFFLNASGQTLTAENMSVLDKVSKVLDEKQVFAPVLFTLLGSVSPALIVLASAALGLGRRRRPATRR